MAKVQEGTHGGIDLLDPHDRIQPDREIAELVEPLNERIEDSLSAALQTVLRRDPGGYVAQKQYVIMRADLRDTEIVFDRFYFMLNLLVDMLPAPMNEPDRIASAAHVKEHAKYAQQSGLKYLPIIGAASLGDIEAALI
jgi:hypothetical protein